MKRVRESGAAYRKKRKAREESMRQNQIDNANSETEILVNNRVAVIKTLKVKPNIPLKTRTRRNKINLPPLKIAPLPPFEDIDETEIDLSDIGRWPYLIDENTRKYLIEQGPEVVQNINSNFAESMVSRSDRESTTLKGGTRRLTRDWFYRTLSNGEKILRTWMAYSTSRTALYCFCCRLFENVNTPGASKFYSATGFKVWWKLNPKVASHEASILHNQNFCRWKILESKFRKTITVTKEEEAIKNKKAKEWQEVLTRMFDIIRFLAKQNLPLTNEDDHSTNRGNFTELVHLLGKYDPVLREYLVKIEINENHSVPYVSSEIQNEFITILGNTVRQKIISHVQKAKYYSIIFDSNPDISYKDQTSLVLRYLKIERQDIHVIESFIDFIDTSNKAVEEIPSMILDKLKSYGLDIMDCRSQACDIAAVTVGKYSGMPEKLKVTNPNIEFVPCSNHSLNLVCLHAASVEIDSVSFFGKLERCFEFFSLSTHRWEILISASGVDIKKTQDTRWSTRCDAVNAIWSHYKVISTSLEKLTETKESFNTRTDAGALLSAIQSFSFLCFLGLWKPVLHGVNEVQNYFQTDGLNVHHCAKKMNTLQAELISKQEELVDGAITYAKNMCKELGITMEPPRLITNGIHCLGDAAFSYENELKRKIFSSFDKIIDEIRERFQQLRNLAETFKFMMPAKLLDPNYHEFNYLNHASDIDVGDFNLERARLRMYVLETGNDNKFNESGPLELLKFILESKLEAILPNIVIMLRIVLTIAMSSASCDRSFSKLKSIKNYLQSTMSTLRLSNLAILAIEQETTDAIDIEGVIKNLPLDIEK